MNGNPALLERQRAEQQSVVPDLYVRLSTSDNNAPNLHLVHRGTPERVEISTSGDRRRRWPSNGAVIDHPRPTHKDASSIADAVGMPVWTP